MKFNRASLLSLLLAAVMLCAACSDDTGGESGQTTSASSTAKTSESSALPQPTEEITTDSTDESSAVTEQSDTDSTEPIETAEPHDTAESADTSEQPPETAEPIETDEPPETTERPPETTPTTTTAATTPPVTEIKPPAPVVLPTVYEPSAPLTSAEVTDTAAIDYSNASKGYIAARYSGESARAKLRITCGDIVCDHDLEADGAFDFYPLTSGSGEYTVKLYEQLDGKYYTEVAAAVVTADIESEFAPFLYPNRYVMYGQDSDCVYTAAEVCAGLDTVVERIAAIFIYITDNVTYDNELAAAVSNGTVTAYVPDPDRALANKKGICYDYASLFAAMARSQGIPTRLVIGYAKDNIYHAWNEVYTTETGWISAELLLKNAGYNILDSTFYANTENKQQVAEYIMNNGNYSAIYRY